MLDPYAVLGVPPTATQAEIAHAYRQQLRTCHPDLRWPANSGADERLSQILDAYDVLRDPRLRAEYDSTRRTHEDLSRPTRIPVTGSGQGNPGPPLWAGPVRWHRR